jgi:hypothetical protein
LVNTVEEVDHEGDRPGPERMTIDDVPEPGPVLTS